MSLPTNEELAQELFEVIADGDPTKVGASVLSMLETMIDAASPIINDVTPPYWRVESYLTLIIDDFNQECERRN